MYNNLGQNKNNKRLQRSWSEESNILRTNCLPIQAILFLVLKQPVRKARGYIFD